MTIQLCLGFRSISNIFLDTFPGMGNLRKALVKQGKTYNKAKIGFSSLNIDNKFLPPPSQSTAENARRLVSLVKN